ncbi:hypothetical protein H0H81_004750 [Sphagnurus paluster]|uniref:GST N-terminal domain-containing protein n=1 Tax=Sphagnurus paluster TaxID=117069 RepID=A0A9P7GMH3_9AGAR|nr:hypothetical protein H0H81_004750 [Sphagnurus paluster]
MSKPITFYDIPCKVTDKSWSPNTWKTRYSLNFKRLPFDTTWVEFPDIPAVSKKIGALPTSAKAGAPHHTLPAIHDPSTGSTIADSVLIAEYLDATYPDTPKLFPPGTRALQLAFIDAFMLRLRPIQEFVMLPIYNILNPASEGFFRSTREETFGRTLEQIAPTGAAGEEQWAKLKEGLGVVHGWLEKGKADGPFVLGQEPAFVDFFLASYIQWLKVIWGEDSVEWKDISSWHDGRWVALVKALEKYETAV